jgi:hypothetical protein
MGVGADLSVATSYDNSSTTGTGGTDTDAFADSLTSALADGTSSGEADRTWSYANEGLTGSVTFTLSALSGPRGSAVAFAHIKEFWLNNTGTAAIALAPGATHGWTPILPSGGITIEPGGCYLISAPVAGYAVSAGASDQITLTVPSGTAALNLALKGTST